MMTEIENIKPARGTDFFINTCLDTTLDTFVHHYFHQRMYKSHA